MQQLSLVDSLFLYAEDSRMPMHIGSLYILAADDINKEFDFEEFKEFSLSRIHLTPVYRRRLIETPLNIGRPYWINDPDFDIENHINHIALPKGGTRADLLKLAAQIYSRPLDRSKPLWSNTIITGLENIATVPKNAFALIAKIHHANIDGVSGTEIQKATFDLGPIPRKVKPPSEEWQPDTLDKIPTKIAKDYVKQMGAFPGKVYDFLTASSNSLLEVAQSGIGIKELGAEVFKPTAPPSIFNQTATAGKVFGFIDVPISQIKKVKTQAGVKVNDVMLAICGGGIRKYLLEKEALPNRSIVAGVPVSLRKAEQQEDMGNQVTMMQVELGTTEKDPLQRLLGINQKTKSSKIIAKASPVNQITKLIPSSVAAAAAKVTTRVGALSRYTPLHNVIITNVPGPPVPLYIAGAKILFHYGLGITMENMGLMITIFSMENSVSITLTACTDMVPDPQVLAEYIRESLAELEHSLEMKEEERTLFQELADKYKLSKMQKELL